ncbi:hypothetical protein [Actinacidiphila bryophytorum]|uniref:Uncharacterized protein n=1 Tax=Actinacidiphila bryophytorum TaxID=1436133 RepID=A0A9W4H7F0_9ACTN|nr:hypothetical protein [Actinacidiphila bryophytorum]MBM9437568.1 hypothetical protein [Actinacidiphila bryophytorum]MBN6542406.1 hypothetical protein [Actinacidiphila bryophytorum]CAG7655910.1 hypothetical protein SBRY_70284 [Actinacidiphila bryophytorum]
MSDEVQPAAEEEEAPEFHPGYSSPHFASPHFTSPESTIHDYTPPDYVVPPFHGPDSEPGIDLGIEVDDEPVQDEALPEGHHLYHPHFTSPHFTTPGSMRHGRPARPGPQPPAATPATPATPPAAEDSGPPAQDGPAR